MTDGALTARQDRALREVVAAGARRCVEDVRRLVAMPTPNPPGDEGPVARYLGGQASLFGATVAYTEPKPGRPNMLAEWTFGTGGPTVLLTSHMDVVPAPPELFQPRVEGDRLYGRGACDAKGPLVSMLAAAAAVAELAEGGLPLNGTLVFAAAIDEESSGSGTDHLAANARFDYAVVGEPTDLNVIRGHRGSLRRHFVFHGRSVHSSDPSRGQNAIYRAARFALGIEALHARLAADVHPDYGAACASLNIIDGGSKVNVVPDRCGVQVDRRLRPGETLADAEREVAAILDEMRLADPDLTWERLPMSGDKDPAVLDADHPLVTAMVAAAGAAIGRRPEVGLFQAGTDMVYLTQRGVPTLVYGPGSLSLAHTVDEYVPIPELALATEAYARLVCRLLAG